MKRDHGPTAIEVRGARVHNLQNVDVDVPLWQLVAIAGVSGSGKSSLAMGVLQAEGARRYLEALSTYTRRRVAQAPRATVDSVRHIPAALALRQRPGVPSVRSTFGTSSELLNVLRILFSRLGSHACPNGHLHPPTLDVAAGLRLTCPVCGVSFDPPGAESLAFNSEGACPRCAGTGQVREVDDAALIPDPSRTIAEGAVAPWGMFGLSVMPQVVAELGVRTDVPYEHLSPAEQETVLEGPTVKRRIRVPSASGKLFDLNFTYRSAREAVREALRKAKDPRGLARVNKFVTTHTCPECLGTRLSPAARSSEVEGLNLAEVSAFTLAQCTDWIQTVPPSLPNEMRTLAQSITQEFNHTAHRLLELGLSYLSLDRSSSTLSTGERQRVQLARAVRNETTGVLYVLDEPSIGLHPDNIDGLLQVMRDLLASGNSVLLVDHDVEILRQADWLIEIGPGSGTQGGRVVATGTVAAIESAPDSKIGGYLAGREPIRVREQVPRADVFASGSVSLETKAHYTVHPLRVEVPRGRLTVVTGVSGSGKTTLVLETLVPALRAPHDPPTHVTAVQPAGIARVELVDATPIGTNSRSTVATYSGVHDALRRAAAESPRATSNGLKPGDFSYNTGSLRCPRCAGTGQIVLDVQFLPDVDIACPACNGSRYAPSAAQYPIATTSGDLSLPQLLEVTVHDAMTLLAGQPRRFAKLQILEDLGLGYLTLGESTPSLSGGEAQRLKLASELGKPHANTMFVFDEPSVGLHPADIRVLLGVFDKLLATGATVVVIEHDIDVIANADFVIDMGPGGGNAGGRIVATGTPKQLADVPESRTGVHLRRFLNPLTAPRA